MIGMEDHKEVKIEQDMTHDDKEEHKKDKRNKHKEQIEKLESEINELKDKLLRNAAELENFKKRMQAERIQDRKYASKTLISDILSPLEQLSMAVNMTTENDLLKNFLIGFKMINDSLFNVLQSDGLKEIDALNKPFDPNLHYAIEKLNDQTKPNGTIVQVISKGYMYKDQLLRPTMVKINEWSEEHGKNE
jgi:molecular chaperone GrpE